MSAIDILLKYPEIFEDRRNIPEECIHDILSYIQSEKVIVQEDQDNRDALLIKEFDTFKNNPEERTEEFRFFLESLSVSCNKPGYTFSDVHRFVENL